MAQEIGAGARTRPRRTRRSRVRRPAKRVWISLLVLGIAAILAGVVLLVAPLLGVFQRGQADQSALNSWQTSGNSAVRGPNSNGGSADAAKTICGSGSASDYALVKFNSPAQYHYAGVAGDGTWDLLTQRSMVHYHGTPDPGQPGNVIIAFHREPDYQNIDQMATGDTITIEDHACRTFVYTVTARYDLAPNKVTQLAPTDGHDLTLITCDPWWQDYNRLVWRATLQSSGSPAPNGAPAPPGAGTGPGNPQF
jgi:LPXTG-site transpeptidase (sortase) family protein